AREGGGDPAANLALQNAIEKARSYSMPKDNIDRAIAKGAGTDADADAYETVLYEGYGPSGVAVLVEALTDHRNRTAADVRRLRGRLGGGDDAAEDDGRGRRRGGGEEDRAADGRARGERRRPGRLRELRHPRARARDRRRVSPSG